jgi:hypothetical protein
VTGEVLHVLGGGEDDKIGGRTGEAFTESALPHQAGVEIEKGDAVHGGLAKGTDGQETIGARPAAAGSPLR